MAASTQSVVPHAGAPLAGRAVWAGLLSQTGEVFTHSLAVWHLLSLDAPTVAALWVVFLSQTAHVALPWQTPAAMFLAVWMLYATDRLLDARGLAAEPNAGRLEARHRFHFQHRRIFVSAILLSCPVLLLLLRHANVTALRLHFTLGSLLLLWMLVVHLRPAAHRLPKELAVGVFFPAAVFIPTVARVPELRLNLLPDAVLFAAVCSLNCLYIYAWEHPRDRRHAHATTRWAVERLPQLTRSTVIASLLLLCAQVVLAGSQRLFPWPVLACVFSLLAMQALHRRNRKIAATPLRAAADLTLLSPAPLLVLQFLCRR